MRRRRLAFGGFIMAEIVNGQWWQGIQQGVSIILAAMPLWTRVNLRRVAPRFPKHVQPGERAELVNDFATAVVDMEEILHSDV